MIFKHLKFEFDSKDTLNLLSLKHFPDNTNLNNIDISKTNKTVHL